VTTSRVSVVGIMTALRTVLYWVRVLVGARIFSYPNRPDRIWGPHTFIFTGYHGSFSEVTAAGL